MKSIIALSAIATLGLVGCKVESTSKVTVGGAKAESYGKLADGREAKLFTLTNKNGMIAKITEYGAILVSLEVPDQDGKVADVTHGYDTLAGWLTNTSYFGATVGRYGNRIADGKFTLDGQEYALATNNEPGGIPCHLHGGIKGFDKVLWKGGLSSGGDPNSVQLTYVSKDGEEGYPGELTTVVTYTLTDDNELIWSAKATVTGKATPVNIVHHSYWNLSGDPMTSINDHELMLNADKFLPTDAGLIPTGDLAPVAGTPFDFTKPTAIGKPGVEYAINTATPVFQISTVYFACDQGVWFRAGSPAGPWTVADTVPEALYDIPPSNPHYNVTYVRVYQSTPQVVYVGYTPGYLGSYHYHGCAVWGTGWHYSPWIGTVYVPRQSTWGFRVMWNPWHGWGFGLTWTNGPFALTIGRTSWGRHSSLWFGPVGFRRFPVRPIGVGFRKTNVNVNINKNINVGARPGGGNRPGGGGTRPGGGGLPDRGGNLYDRPQNRDRVADRPMPREGQEPRRVRGQDNNVLTDRDGNVYRQDRKGDWQQREGNDWSKAENLDRVKRDGDRPSQQPGSRDRAPGAGQRSREQANSRGSQQWTAPSTGGLGQSSRSRGSSSGGGGSATRPQLERDQRARQRGNQRSGSYSSAGRSGRSGGGRGGGGRRR